MKKLFDVECPTIPNFLTTIVDGERKGISLSEFTDDEIRAIAEEWTQRLRAAAKEKRETKYPSP